VDEKTGAFKPMAETLHIRQAMTDKECGIFRLKTGRFVLKWMPHVCYMSHPGEATWNPEWTQNRNAARPPRGDPRGGAHHREPQRNGHELLRNWRSGVPAAPPSIGRPPSTNRFSHLEADW
jgi:hypothetical protein